MSEYKGIHGGKIQNFTTNPDNPIEGQVWYNETDGNWKVSSLSTVGSWATGGNLNTARSHLSGSGLTKTAALAFGGLDASPTNGLTLTESYNGSAWTEVNDLNTGRYDATGLGSQTSSLFVGGFNPASLANNESWNGTSWTEVGDLNTARGALASSGLDNTSGLVFGGQPVLAITESWNGTSWTEVNDLNTGRDGLAGTGNDNTAALAIGGITTVVSGNSESWNGTSWTEVNDLNSARRQLGSGGLYTSAVAFGGENPASATLTLTETWNGTSWSEDGDMSTARNFMASTGANNTDALASGGPPSGSNAATEEWTGAGASVIETITTS